MGFFDFLKGDPSTGSSSSSDDVDPMADVTLAQMREGFMVDYDLETWTVTARHRYEYDGEKVLAWELESASEKRFLEHEEDDWTLSQTVPIGRIESDETDNVRRHLAQHDDPPAQITFKGTTYYLEESGTGRFFKNEEPPAQQVHYWDFVDHDSERFLSIEQWGKQEFETSAGRYVEEYQFSNLLPGSV